MKLLVKVICRCKKDPQSFEHGHPVSWTYGALGGSMPYEKGWDHCGRDGADCLGKAILGPDGVE